MCDWLNSLQLQKLDIPKPRLKMLIDVVLIFPMAVKSFLHSELCVYVGGSKEHWKKWIPCFFERPRKDPNATVELMKLQLGTALSALVR